MAIDNQFRDKKLQYDINKEAAKISALSSGKIDNYEYLTGEETLPSNQKQIIEQPKFTYSPLAKPFEKQTKTIKDKKKVEALKDLTDNKKQLDNCDDYKNKLFQNIYNERLNKIEKLTKKIGDNDLNFIVNSTVSETGFSEADDPITFLNKIKSNEITLEEAKASQKDFNEYLKLYKEEKN